jgi:hypothetical protein
MTVPELVLALAAPANALSPSTTAETAATEANLIPLICSPHGRAGREPSPDIDVERIYLLKYTSADIHVKNPPCAAVLEYLGHLAEAGLDTGPGWVPDVRGRC